VMLVNKVREGPFSYWYPCLPILVGCFRLDFGPATQADVSNFRPTGTPTQG